MLLDLRVTMRAILPMLLGVAALCVPARAFAQTANIAGSWAGTAAGGQKGHSGLLFLTLDQTGLQVLGSFSYTDNNNGSRVSAKVFGSMTETTFTFVSDPFTDSGGCGNQLTNGNAQVTGTTMQGTLTVINNGGGRCGSDLASISVQFSVAKSTTVYCGTYTGNPDSGVFSVEVSASGIVSGIAFPTNGRGSAVTLTGQVSGTTLSATSNQGNAVTGTIQNGTVSGTFQITGGGTGTFSSATTSDRNACSPGLTTFAISNLGGLSSTTAGSADSVSVGYASIQPNSGSTTPSGLAIFGFRQNNVLVTEAGVPASAVMRSGRIYAEVNGPVNTGLAIANPNTQSAAVSFFFTDQSGNSFGNGTTTIPAKGQIAAFLNQSPFNGSSSLTGAFTFSSSVPLAVIALRGLTNERGEFLITTLPVADLNASTVQSTVTFPHFADGGGWTTQIILVNPTGSTLTGTIQFRDQSGQNAAVSVNGQSNNNFVYSIPAQSSQRLQTSGAAASILVGSVAVVPAGNGTTPSGLAVFSFRNGGTTVTEAGVPAVSAGAAFRLYAEASGNFNSGASGSIQTGLAVVNTSSSVASVTLQLSTMDGSSTGLTGTLSVPANGKAAMFLNQIQGLSSLQPPFQGILRVSSQATISVVGLRGRYNERGDFLITTTPPINEAATASTSPLFFPHLADSGGYTTQFILFSGQPGQSASGTFQMFSQSGQALNLIVN